MQTRTRPTDTYVHCHGRPLTPCARIGGVGRQALREQCHFLRRGVGEERTGGVNTGWDLGCGDGLRPLLPSRQQPWHWLHHTLLKVAAGGADNCGIQRPQPVIVW